MILESCHMENRAHALRAILLRSRRCRAGWLVWAGAACCLLACSCRAGNAPAGVGPAPARGTQPDGQTATALRAPRSATPADSVAHADRYRDAVQLSEKLKGRRPSADDWRFMILGLADPRPSTGVLAMSPLCRAIGKHYVSLDIVHPLLEERVVAAAGDGKALWLVIYEGTLNLPPSPGRYSDQAIRISRQSLQVGRLDAKAVKFIDRVLADPSEEERRDAALILVGAGEMRDTDRAYALRCVDGQLSQARGDHRLYWRTVREAITGQLEVK